MSAPPLRRASYSAVVGRIGDGRARRRQMTEAAGSRRARWRANGRRGDGAHVPTHGCCWMARRKVPLPAGRMPPPRRRGRSPA
ncbi:hypothetical protein ACP4OV_025562 [Aristida adscensionis]